jgi:hypothetical protein
MLHEVYNPSLPLDYYELVEDCGVEKNANINVLKENKEKYLKPFEYVEAQVNVLDEVPRSYSHQRNSKLDQTRCITKTKDREFVDSEAARLLFEECAFCEEEGHAIMDCPFVHFHIKIGIARHVELQNVATTLMDQP